MKKVDLHELSADEAIKVFLIEYKQYQTKRETFKVVHGYGSSGEGGKIMRRIRRTLSENSDKLKFTFGEDIDGNPGYTIIYPQSPIPQFSDLLAQEILAFCESSKIQEKILAKFRKHGESQVIKALKNLEQKKMIKAGNKGNYKTWTAF